jgi:YVTN family beta-propeller protein
MKTRRHAHLWSRLISNKNIGEMHMKNSQASKRGNLPAGYHGNATLLIAVAAILIGSLAMTAPKKADAAPTRSTTIALTSDEQRLVVVNREANSVSIIKVKNAKGRDVSNKLAEIAVGEEPRCVAIHPSDRAAYVTNAISGTVSVVNLNQNRVVKTLEGLTEPRGCALTPDGSLLYVANHTAGTVSIIDTSNPLNPIVTPNVVQVGDRPWAIAITNNTVFVTDAFAELIPNGPGEASDQGKQGVVNAFPAGNGNPPITKITLAPLADSGFTANRTSPNNFCGAAAHSLIFCPRPDLPANDPANTMNPQGVFPNQLTSALIRGNRLYLPNIGSQPEPPEFFNVNVQALVYNVDVNALVEVPSEHVNLNNQIKVETAQPPPQS